MHEVLDNGLVKLAQDMTIAFDWNVKQQNKQNFLLQIFHKFFSIFHVIPFTYLMVEY